MSTDVDSARLFGERKVKSRVLFSFSFFFSLLGNEILISISNAADRSSFPLVRAGDSSKIIRTGPPRTPKRGSFGRFRRDSSKGTVRYHQDSARKDSVIDSRTKYKFATPSN